MTCVPDVNRATLVGAVHLFLINFQGNLLIMRRTNAGYGDRMFSVPAGHTESGESSVAAVIREAREEIGITIEPEHLQLVHIMNRRSVGTDCTNSERVDFFFVCRYWTGTPVNQESHKCDLMLWKSPRELPDNTVDYVKRAIESWRHYKFYSELGWNDPCPRCGSGGS